MTFRPIGCTIGSIEVKEDQMQGRCPVCRQFVRVVGGRTDQGIALVVAHHFDHNLKDCSGTGKQALDLPKEAKDFRSRETRKAS